MNGSIALDYAETKFGVVGLERAGGPLRPPSKHGRDHSTSVVKCQARLAQDDAPQLRLM